ncbi:hypothetical protein BFL43_13975 [Williamsia sp. 1135]|nr:hypothetical protein BFL43_13975 [Williamsia sp. 1135]
MDSMCDSTVAETRNEPRALNWHMIDAEPVMLTWVPGVLLVASFGVSLMAGLSSSGSALIAMAVLSVAAFGVHLSWIRARTLAVGPRILVFAAQLGLTAALVWFSPFYGIYGFIAYITAMLLFDGAALVVAFCAIAPIQAASQIGGFKQIPSAPGAFVALLVVNAAIVIVVQWLGTRRAREMNEREIALRKLEEAQQRNAELHDQLLERAREQGVLEERARLSREIHDTVAQDLVAIVSQLEAIEPGDVAAERVETAKRLARSGLGEARRAVDALKSPMLDGQPLSVALADVVHAWSTVNAISADVQIEGHPVSTEDDQNLLRICQEALSNVSRHAAAKMFQWGCPMSTRASSSTFETTAQASIR